MDAGESGKTRAMTFAGTIQWKAANFQPTKQSGQKLEMHLSIHKAMFMMVVTTRLQKTYTKMCRMRHGLIVPTTDGKSVQLHMIPTKPKLKKSMQFP